MTESPTQHPRPLEGLRVLDMTVALAGPYGTLLLAALGAEVIKIEAPGGGDIARHNPPFYGDNGIHFGALADGDVSLSVLARARNKKSVTLDLKSEAGRELFYELVRHADIVFENSSDGVTQRLGVDYETVRAINPRIVYASVSGLGIPTLYPGVKAMDITVQALSGLMDTTGNADGPPTRVGIAISDLLAPLYAVIGIQSALLQRAITGAGQHVVVSMLESLVSLLPFEHLDVLQRNGFPARSGNRHNRLAPFGVYGTRDGHVSIAAANDDWTRLLFAAMGTPQLADDARFSGRGPRAVHAGELDDLIEQWTGAHTSAEVIAELAARGVPCVPVRTALEVLSDPEMFERGALERLEHPRAGVIDAVAGGIPIHMSAATVGLGRPAPELGDDNDEVFGTLLGLDADRLQVLREKRVI
ncbi:CaiB/BaiF CoA transferase family protein [Nocardia stercoris]|uniref:CoA transferase n=1 Tax=Nocardia stercoris TaxID=2483361 RepID=A0A3M2L2V6_9NOCA|nr:CoA transferase [Nocardia stercoris]RMI28848.1 CoA transferase [Nocardia stercoris]